MYWQLTLIMMKNLRISLYFQDLNDSCDDDGELKVENPYEEFWTRNLKSTARHGN